MGNRLVMWSMTTWPWKVKVMTPKYLRDIILKRLEIEPRLQQRHDYVSCTCRQRTLPKGKKQPATFNVRNECWRRQDDVIKNDRKWPIRNCWRSLLPGSLSVLTRIMTHSRVGKTTVISYGELQRLKIVHDYISGTYKRTSLSQGKTAINVHST